MPVTVWRVQGEGARRDLVGGWVAGGELLGDKKEEYVRLVMC